MFCTCVWKPRQYCVCSRSLVLSDLSVSLNRRFRFEEVGTSYQCSLVWGRCCEGCDGGSGGGCRGRSFDICVCLQNPRDADKGNVLLTACETAELLFYLSIITKNMKRALIDEDNLVDDYLIFKHHTLCVESVTAVRKGRDEKENVSNKLEGVKAVVYTLIQQINSDDDDDGEGVLCSIKMSRDSTFAMYDYLQAVFQLNHNEMYDWIRNKIRYGDYHYEQKQRSNMVVVGAVPSINFAIIPYY